MKDFEPASRGHLWQENDSVLYDRACSDLESGCGLSVRAVSRTDLWHPYPVVVIGFYSDLQAGRYLSRAFFLLRDFLICFALYGLIDGVICSYLAYQLCHVSDYVLDPAHDVYGHLADYVIDLDDVAMVWD